MTIKRLSASFGVLKNSRLHLKPGLNIIQAPNEQGKSTWCAFIRAMLYGIHTAEGEETGLLPEKIKYRPWDGGPMEGFMEIEAGGRTIAISRRALGSAPMKRIDVRCGGSGEEITALVHENLGEDLAGVPEAVFTRSAFIRQAGLKVSQTGQLEQRIATLASSGEEGLSYRDTAYTLGVWQRQRKHNKTGKIPALQSEMGALDQTLSQLKEAAATYNEISLDRDRAMSRVAELQADLDAHTEMEQRARRQEIADAKKKLQDLDWEINSLKKELRREGEQIAPEQIFKARESYERLGIHGANYAEGKKRREAAERDLRVIQEALLHSRFEGRSLEEAEEVVSHAALKQAAAETADSFDRRSYNIPLALCSVFAIGGFTLYHLTALPFYWLSALSVGTALVFGALLYRKWALAKKAAARRASVFSRLRVGSMEELKKELSEYERLCARAEQLQQGFLEADRFCEKTMEEMQTLRDSFEADVRGFAPDAEGLAEAFGAMSEMSKLADRLEAAEAGREAAAHLYATLTASYEGDPNAPIPKGEHRLPLRSKSETGYDLKRMENELDALKNSYAIGLGEVRALGDPLVLGTKRKAMAARLEDLKQQYEALELAAAALKEADKEMSARFSPLLEQRAGQYIDWLSNGQYKRVLLDESLSPSAERAGESVSRDSAYLSGGTRDQIYLALRLALCDLTLPRDKICPFILDDALAGFDDLRLQRALRLLKELAKTRQVILFTCHSREAAFFSGDESVNVLDL